MLKGIRNLIFDLGGVIIDLDQHKLLDQLSALTGISPPDFKTSIALRPEFIEYEKGLISDSDFRDFFRSVSSNSLTDAEIDQAWNAILLEIPSQRLTLLEQLNKDFSVFLLSNTNNIHLTEINRKLNQMGFPDFSPFFDRQYYSHLLHERKPDQRIYEIVLEESSIVPSETLFLDDNLENLEGAKKLGIQTFHVEHPDLILELFDAR